MDSVTPGIRYGRGVSKDGHLRARLEYMHQSSKASEFDTYKATIFQIAYSKQFYSRSITFFLRNLGFLSTLNLIAVLALKRVSFQFNLQDKDC